MQRFKVFTWMAGMDLAITAVLFFSAGQTALAMFWVYIAVMVVISMAAFFALCSRIPEMMQERSRSSERNQDKDTGPIFLILLLSHWIIAGLDVGRAHWSSTVPSSLQIIGLVISGCGSGLLAWSLVVNQFYSHRVDIQTERGQEVITTGPYRFVRHPGYIGWILFFVFSGIALGSWLSILPMLLLAALMIRRTLIEDQMLRRDLKGYNDYAQQVRYRLIPGLW